ncbi:PREDICTED: NEP1-interacting protein-like 2 [Tarenaya hassleriana]|uniref:NEP1-interacting protein-like 2 n=1 Tax=Tarenaya hassleriana TaxID=28532 RepID=UPI00053C5AF1|nr:PREDICTED: NEP1-interacting protein-like 2 [Tarenaya hassleriana]
MSKHLSKSIAQMISRSKEAVSCFVRDEIAGFPKWFVLRFLARAVFGVFIGILASGSVLVAAAVGAARGHTTGTGLIQGGLVGVMVGVVTAVQTLKSAVEGQPLSNEVALLRRVVDGKAIMELASPAILKAYQWQTMEMETSFQEISEYMYDINGGIRCLSRNDIQRLPVFNNCFDHQIHSDCSICLQEWKIGEEGRKLGCGHAFHVNCIDAWLTRQGTCPICRKRVSNYTFSS